MISVYLRESMSRDKSKITRMLIELQSGEGRNEELYDELFSLVYEQLRLIAHARIKDEYRQHTYSKTALVHEVYLKMIDQQQIRATNRSHFYAIASRCMRQILVDHARKKNAEKRGGDRQKITYADHLLENQEKARELLDIDEKLRDLARLNERLSEVVELRFFGDMSVAETAEALGISPSTVKRDWAKARGWLYKELN